MSRGALARAMRAAILAILFVLPLFLMQPAAADPCRANALAGANGFYVVAGTCNGAFAPVVASAGPVHDGGVGIEGCDWNGAQVGIWQESNGVDGLQNGGTNPDTELVGGFAGRAGRCSIS